VEVHAHALAQILDGAASDDGPWVASGAVALAAAAGLTLAAVANGPALVLGLVALLLAIWAGSAMAFGGGGPMILPMSSTLTLGLAAGSVRALHGWRIRRDQRLLSQLFARLRQRAGRP
jgi:hypothetical protein